MTPLHRDHTEMQMSFMSTSSFTTVCFKWSPGVPCMYKICLIVSIITSTMQKVLVFVFNKIILDLE